MKKRMVVFILMSLLVLQESACGQVSEKVSVSEVTENSDEKTEGNVVNEETDSTEQLQEDEPQAASESAESVDTKRDIPIKNPIEGNISPSDGFVYESYDDGTCTLTKVGNCKDTEIVIPQKSPDGDTITNIAEFAFYEAEAERIIFSGVEMEIDDRDRKSVV